MPELSLNSDKDVLFVATGPGDGRPDEISFPSFQATDVIEEVADEIGSTAEKVEKALLRGKTIEF